LYCKIELQLQLYEEEKVKKFSTNLSI
jgi:hypothetical protein